MNTRIGTTFGLAFMVALGVLATMLALGMFTSSKVGADVGGAHVVTVTLSPASAGAVAKYTISATGAAGNIDVGQDIFVTFNASTTVPASISPANVTLRASAITGGATPLQTVNAGAVTVSGQVVTITVPDMDPSVLGASIGDQGILSLAGITITFAQAAGITNPKLAQTVLAAVPYTLTVSNDVDTDAATSTPYAITSFVTFTPAVAARGATVTVNGGGFAANCTTCNIRLNPQGVTAPTTGSAGSASVFDGSGTIDANGLFTGSFVATATTSGNRFIWVTDGAGSSTATATAFVQLAGATPQATTASPGSTVTVDLVDFNLPKETHIANNSTTIGGVEAANAAGVNFTINNSDISGDTLPLAPYAFVVPATTPPGTHVVTITDSGLTAKAATFNLEVALRSLVVTPNEAAPGQAIIITGSNFSLAASTTIPINFLTMSATPPMAATTMNTSLITVNPDGSFLFTGTVPLDDDSVGTTGAKTFTATDSTTLVGVSSGFTLTARTLTAPATAAPGSSVTISGTGMSVGTSAVVTITSNGTALPTTTFTITPTGTFSGILLIPATQTPGVITLTATDNSATLNNTATANKTATTNVTIAGGTLTVTPATGSTGNSVTIVGSGWPINQSLAALTIGGGNALVAGVVTDTLGGFTVQTTVPAAALGGSLVPSAVVVSVTIGTVTATTPFTVATPSITSPATAVAGEEITMTFTGFNALSALTLLNFGSAIGLPNPAPVMDGSGNATALVRVPALNPGTYNVTVNSGGNFVGTGTITITATPTTPVVTTTNTEDVFATEITADNLVRVWWFSNELQTWSFFDPRPAFAMANTYTTASTGAIVWVNVTAETTFQGQTLFPGWNLISLN